VRRESEGLLIEENAALRLRLRQSESTEATLRARLATRQACNSTVADKARNRMRACAAPAVLAARNLTPLPVLWSRALCKSQPKFINESPFEVKAFERYLPWLPERSSLASVLNGKPPASCAVVGASGTLLSRTHGELVDSHTIVLRTNWLKLRGYEKHVGTRTSFNVIFGLENMVDQFIRSQRKLPADRRAYGLVTPASKRSVSSFFRYLGRLRTNRTHKLHRPDLSDPPLYLLSDAIWQRAVSHLCDATGGGCVWPTRSSTMRPSSGFYAALVAMHTCRNVSLFGMTSEPCAPFHYYGPAKTECTLAVPKENDESVHWFDKEHEIYGDWQRQGRLRVYS
jgi:hypothetical protein